MFVNSGLRINNMFGKKKEDRIYQDGYAEGERKTIELYNSKLEDKENYYQGELEKKDFEITRLNLQLTTWKKEHESDIKKESDLKKREAQLKSETYNMEKFKDMLRERLHDIMKEQVDETQALLALLGDNKQLEEK